MGIMRIVACKLSACFLNNLVTCDWAHVLMQPCHDWLGQLAFRFLVAKTSQELPPPPHPPLPQREKGGEPPNK